MGIAAATAAAATAAATAAAIPDEAHANRVRRQVNWRRAAREGGLALIVVTTVLLLLTYSGLPLLRSASASGFAKQAQTKAD